MTDTSIERLSEFRGNDLADLCDAAEVAIVRSYNVPVVVKATICFGHNF